METLMSDSENLIHRFLRYVAVSTQSNGSVADVPSNPNEFELAKLLATELTAMGLTNIEISEFGCLTAKLASNLPDGIKAP